MCKILASSIFHQKISSLSAEYVNRSICSAHTRAVICLEKRNTVTWMKISWTYFAFHIQLQLPERKGEGEKSFANFLPSISLLSFCVLHLSYFCLFPLWTNFHLSFANLHIMHNVWDTDLLAAVLIDFSLSLFVLLPLSLSGEKPEHTTYIFNSRTL